MTSPPPKSSQIGYIFWSPPNGNLRIFGAFVNMTWHKAKVNHSFKPSAGWLHYRV
jgi:hypothetical protein